MKVKSPKTEVGRKLACCKNRKDTGMAQWANGRVRDRQRPDGGWSYRNDEEVWNFSKGKASLSRSIYDLIYISKGFL